MKATTGIMFVAATCIGSGMIALPITLVKIGIIPAILVMLAIWFIIYYTSLINLELNLQAGKGMALDALCKHFSGKKTQLLSTILLHLLLYSLLSAYITGGSLIIEEILGIGNLSLPYTIILFFILYLQSNLINRINNILFVILLGVILLLLGFLATSVNWFVMPLFENNDISVWLALIPVVFTSFGFQVIFHTVTKYYKYNPFILKKVFFWGSLIPAIIYIVWTSSVVGAIYNNSKEFYQQMILGSVNISQLITQLSLITNNPLIQTLVMWLSFLAIATSAIGVGLGLVDKIGSYINEQNIKTQAKNNQLRFLSAALTVFPPYFIAFLSPNAFTSILSFAGIILSLIAIILPIYLLSLVKKDFYYPHLKNKFLINLSLITGISIIICGMCHMFKK